MALTAGTIRAERCWCCEDSARPGVASHASVSQWLELTEAAELPECQLNIIDHSPAPSAPPNLQVTTIQNEVRTEEGSDTSDERPEQADHQEWDSCQLRWRAAG